MAPTSDQGNLFTLHALSDPLALQANFLDRLQALVTSDQVPTPAIVDPNNVACFCLESFSTTTAEVCLAMEHDVATTNAKRAQVSNDLYKHMSDFDYVDLFSTPASAIGQLILDKTYLCDNAKVYNENYLKVIIPRNTVFQIGQFTFGIHYPIEIRINRHTRSCLVLYDTDETNPLQRLTQNILEKREYTHLGREYLIITFPVYQFARTRLTEDLAAANGFTKVYDYLNRFYAARLFTTVNGETIELHQTLSGDSYDPYVATARLALQPENRKLQINIPQVYFTEGKVGRKLTLELYTTMGALDSDLSTILPETIKVNYGLDDPDVSPYARVLAQVPWMVFNPVSLKVVGGSNGYSFEELRSRVVNDSFHTTALVTPMDLHKYFEDKGFTVEKYLDNLTDRIYYAYRVLTDGEGSIVQATHVPVKLYEGIENEVSTIVRNLDGSMTILPTTLFLYSDGGQSCTPLTDTEVANLAALARTDLITEMNRTPYTRSPFHVRLIVEDRYPRVSSYNLMNPEIRDFVFERDNDQITSMMVAITGGIVHRNQGTGGYLVRLVVNKSSDLANVPEEDLAVYVCTTSSGGDSIGTVAKFVGTQDDNAVYEFEISTDYYLSKDHQLNILSLTTTNQGWSHLVDLESTFRVMFLLDKKYFPNTTTDVSLYEDIPIEFWDSHLCMVRQKFTVDLGNVLDDVIYNNTDLQWAGRTYLTYPTDEYLTYPADVYARDSAGALVHTVVDGKVQLQKLHSKGDPILDEQGRPMLAHAKGDIVLDAYGHPTVTSERVKLYYVHMVHLDARLFVSEHPTQVAYRNGLTEQLETYFSVLREASGQLLEQTQLYFRPTRTMGTALFNIGDGVQARLALAMDFKIKCHMPERVVKDEKLKALVEETIVGIIETFLTKNNISMTEIASAIKEKAADYIDSVDVLGINGNMELQTISIADTDARPSLSQKLYLTKDGVLGVKKSVQLETVTS